MSIIILFVMSVLAFVAGVSIEGSARSAVHEIYAAVCFLTAAVLFSGCMVVAAVTNLRKDLKEYGDRLSEKLSASAKNGLEEIAVIRRE